MPPLLARASERLGGSTRVEFREHLLQTLDWETIGAVDEEALRVGTLVLAEAARDLAGPG